MEINNNRIINKVRNKNGKNMKKVLMALTALAVLVSCKDLKVSVTKAQHVEAERQLTDFERIEQFGAMDVRYSQADSFSVRVKAPKDIIGEVETRVENHQLIISMKGNDKRINLGVADSDDVTVYVTSPDLIGVELRGSGDFDCKGLLDTDILDIVLKGSGDVEFDDIICDRVNVALVGSGDVEVKNVQTQRSMVELVGSGDIKMKFTNSGAVESRLTGSGDITLKGVVRSYNYLARGSGDMHTEGLITQNR